MHRWFAAHGYACARVDIAGMGDSDGLVEDEYAQREQDDGMEVIEWLATQAWSSGSVGMIGISWGGFNGLQMAARRPPALKALISLCVPPLTATTVTCILRTSHGCEGKNLVVGEAPRHGGRINGNAERLAILGQCAKNLHALAPECEGGSWTQHKQTLGDPQWCSGSSAIVNDL